MTLSVTHLINWRELITNITFPSVLMSLILDEPIQDYRMLQQLSDEQITSQLTREMPATSASLHYKERYRDKFKNESITQLWIILLVLFWSLERLLSERFKKAQEPSKLNKAFNSDNVSHSSDILISQTLRGKHND